MTDNLNDLHSMIDQRDIESHAPWAHGQDKVLLDLATDPNRYLWDLAHQIPILPGLDFLTAICAVFPGFRFAHTPTVPSYRRWRDIPSAWMLARAIDYGLHPPEIDEVTAEDLREGDLIIHGPPPSRVRHRLHDHNQIDEHITYTLIPVANPGREYQLHARATDPARRERPFPLNIPAGAHWADLDEAPDKDGVIHRRIEAHPRRAANHLHLAEQFLRDQVPNAHALRLHLDFDGPRCHHGQLLVSAQYRLREDPADEPGA